MAHIVLARAWNNGKFLPNGGGYGIWLTNYFKDEYLDVNWDNFSPLKTGSQSNCRKNHLQQKGLHTGLPFHCPLHQHDSASQIIVSSHRQSQYNK